MQKDCAEGIADFMGDPRGQAAQQRKVLHPLRLLLQPLAGGHFPVQSGRALCHVRFEGRRRLGQGGLGPLAVREVRLGLLVELRVAEREGRGGRQPRQDRLVRRREWARRRVRGVQHALDLPVHTNRHREDGPGRGDRAAAGVTCSKRGSAA